MAKKKDQNEDPEEEKKDQFDEDEDFGLPDLEYDELEEEADEDISEEPEAESEPEEQVPDPEPEPEADLEGELGDDEDWEKELEEELDEDIKSGKFDENAEAFYEEESFEEFDEDGGQESVGSSVFGIDEKEEPDAVEEKSGDDFYTGVEEKESEPVTAFEPQYSQYLDEGKGEGKSKFVRTVVLGTILFFVVATVLWFLWKQTGEGESEKKMAKVEKKEPVKTEPVEPVEVKKEEPKEEKPKPAPKKAVANTVPAGEIQSLDQRTGKSYVVIASFFDDDLAMDYARKLANDGKSPYIIAPFKEHRFYRVAIAEFDTFNDAEANVQSYSQEFGIEAWPLRY